MKRIPSLLLSVLVALSVLAVFAAIGCDGPVAKYPYEATYRELGIPLKDYYTTGSIRRCVWDLEVFNDGLYVGGGDYDTNAGPVSIWHLDLKTGEWINDGKVDDEQVERFTVLGGRLTVPGIDPKDSWADGNIYVLDNGVWTKKRVLPGGIHNFDLIEFDGKIFAGMGVNINEYPVAVSTDGGETFEQVKFYKDGKPIRHTSSAVVRVYDLFTLKGNLYAYYFYKSSTERITEIYRYENDSFVYHSDMASQLSFERQTYSHINQKVEFGGKQIIATGRLYSSEDMITANELTVRENAEVIDLRVINNVLYLLCNESVIKADGTEEFRVSVWRSDTGDSFEEMFYFYYPVRALSFTYSDGVFYFGMGYGMNAQTDYEQNGMILAVENEL